MTEATATPPDTAPAPPPAKRRRVILVLGIVGGMLLTLFVVGFIIQATTLKAYFIPSEAMIPTLQVGDRVLVHKGTDRGDDVRRGDIVVFANPPGSPSTIKVLIKRVIGLPGETVTIDEGHVLIDGQVLDEPYLAPGTLTEAVGSNGCAPATPCVIPAGQVFVLGDNRTNSADSRFTGPVLQSTIVGRAVYRTWPLSRLHAL